MTARDLRQAVLCLAACEAPSSETVEEGLARCEQRLAMPQTAIAAEIAALVAAGLLHDPVRLPQGALQCHWRLEATAAGRASAKRRQASNNG